MRKSTRRLGNAFGGLSLHLPPAETLGGWGLALLLISWLLTLPIVNTFFFSRYLQPISLMLGILLLTVALVSSLVRGRAGANSQHTWRGEQVNYGSPYGGGFLNRLRRTFAASLRGG